MGHWGSWMIEEVGGRGPKGVKLDILMIWLLTLWNNLNTLYTDGCQSCMCIPELALLGFVITHPVVSRMTLCGCHIKATMSTCREISLSSSSSHPAPFAPQLIFFLGNGNKMMGHY